jgi:3-hydroxymyristoyl/3-hydroxydecanoyl-(acyl carrier protein) dehydratase
LKEAPSTPEIETANGGGRPAWLPRISDVTVDRTARSLSCRLQVPADLAVFRSHFPHAPIVPGVLQVGWAVELAREHGLATGRCEGISTVKFRRLVRPGMRLLAHLRAGKQPGELNFRYEAGDDVVTTGRLRFEGDHD